MGSIFVNWGESLVKLTWKKDVLPPRELITSVHGFCFLDYELLIVHLTDRGWDLPGGHIEKGETPKDCLNREVMEEGYVEGDCQLLGALEVDHHDNPMWDQSSPYPIVGYQLFYKLHISKVHPFKGGNESDKRKFIHPSDIAKYRDWLELHQEMLDYAITFSSRI